MTEKTLSDEEILNRAMISLNGEIYADTEKKSRKMGNAVRKAIKDAISEARKQAIEEKKNIINSLVEKNGSLHNENIVFKDKIENLEKQLKEAKEELKEETEMQELSCEFADDSTKKELIKAAAEIFAEIKKNLWVENIGGLRRGSIDMNDFEEIEEKYSKT